MRPVSAVWAVVVAAGSGARFGGPKQFADLAGRVVAERSVDACRSVAATVVLVVPPGCAQPAHGADAVVPGGPTRSASVRCGLAAVPDDVEVVVVHDAARPLAGPGLFRAVTQALVDPQVDAAICAVPVADTIKRVVDETVVETLHRPELVAVQTPQAFRADTLRRAHRGEPEATDDAALVEALGGVVRVVPGDPANIKLTTAADLERAAAACGTGVPMEASW